MRLVCGLQAVREAIRARGAELERVLVEAPGREASPQLDAIARFARDHGARVERPQRAELDRIAHGVRHQGVIAIAPELPIVAFDALPLDERSLIVALDEVQDPQNFGAVIRSSVAMGATGILWPEHRAAPLSAATFRASAGAVEHARLCRVPSLPPALEDLRDRGFAVVGLDVAGEVHIDRVSLMGPTVIVVGAEDKGLRKTVKRVCTSLVRLPMPGPIGSLNASVATAIALYETVRQRGATAATSATSGTFPASD